MGTIEKKSLHRGTFSLSKRPGWGLPPSALILIRASLFSSALFLLCSVIKTALFSSTTSTSSSLLLYSYNQDQPEWARLVQDQMGSISCSTVKERIDQGIWHDPNHGQVFARKLITEPSFTIAVHNQTYDPVRWDTLFVQGKYYEDLVFARFVKILAQNSPQKSMVLDVGANIGFYTLLSATLGYPVVSFEINPANLVRLCESLHINHLQATLFQKGVSNEDGIPLQVLVPKNPGQAFLREMEDTTALEKYNMKNDSSTHHAFTTTVTLDTFGQTMGWLNKDTTTNKRISNTAAAKDWEIAILKLDVEGKEPQIIEGAKALLKSGRVKNVLTEFRRLARPTIQEAITTLLDAGYTLIVDDDDDEEERKKPGKRLSRKDSQAYLDDLAEKYKGKGRNFDFWFQR